MTFHPPTYANLHAPDRMSFKQAAAFPWLYQRPKRFHGRPLSFVFERAPARVARALSRVDAFPTSRFSAALRIFAADPRVKQELELLKTEH